MKIFGLLAGTASAPRRGRTILVFLMALGSAVAQQVPKSEPRPIQDNSFLVEEAYNQEPGVIQHISLFSRFWMSKDLLYTFTQEWPVPHHARHQLSYTIAAFSPGAADTGIGLGDIEPNYRYQLVGNGEARVAFAPRLSLLAPTGDARLGRGAGGWGVQTSLPASIVLSRRFVTHLNAGATIIPSGESTRGDRAALHGYNLGHSLIWLARPRLNFMLETVWSGSETVVGPAATQRQHSLLISPGLRWAYNFASGLQIVPGVGVPLGIGPSAGEKGIVLYLSFEHPLWSEKSEKKPD